MGQAVATILAIGMSWSHIRRQMSGQYDVDRVDEDWGTDLEPVWDEFYSAEQARILRLLIERIDVAPDGISLTLHAAGIRSLVAELADAGEAPAPAASEALLEAAE